MERGKMLIKWQLKKFLVENHLKIDKYPFQN